MSASGTHMVVFDQMEIPLKFHDLSASLSDARDDQVHELGRKDMGTAFDIINGPLFRTVLIKVNSTHHLLRLTGHHVVCDGWEPGDHHGGDQPVVQWVCDRKTGKAASSDTL